jgi:hypothetical protein
MTQDEMDLIEMVNDATEYLRDELCRVMAPQLYWAPRPHPAIEQHVGGDAGGDGE